LAWHIADYDIDTYVFKIWGSRHKTLEYANKVLDDRQALIKTYHFITGDHRLALPLYACRQVVLRHIQVKWFEFNGFEVPVQVTSNLETEMAKAATKTAEDEQGSTEAKTKEPRITNRSIIEAGLLAGKSDEDILAEVKERFPDGKADSKHVAYYRHFLTKEGKLEKQPRKSRAKAEATEEAPAPAKAAAAPAAKKAPAKAAPAPAARKR
jgi:hypothetical protein